MRLARTSLLTLGATAALGAGAATAGAETPAPAPASPMHLVGVGVRFQFATPAGQALTDKEAPVAGDTVIAEAHLYTRAPVVREHRGDRRGVEGRAVGVAHLSCTLTSNQGAATCTALVTIAGEGQLTGTNVAVNFAATGPLMIPLNGGTGAFAGTTAGTVKVESVGNSNLSHFMISYS